ncbi:hypothetical protein CISG_05487 [Coccidioides immitis RMSCC 3703]|uniref:Uncharacterized protein n=1 Tax=Coccidioides immitis RMSCC 3703 TaxID=454286 RepID=A0A0J8TQH5_COCIT|nr:hypothetical protein CISG_05487 [Coccidioides immitis RMSCC 3703]
MGKIMWYLPRKYISPLAFKILIAVELPFTVAVLALFGIASPNLYRTKLWQDGADNGFNSSPDELVYRYANYEPYTVPRPWTQFVIFLAQFVLAVISCLPTEETRERQREKREKLETLAELKSLKSPCYPNFYQGENGLQPITPRTMAFNQLGGANDLPLRGDTTSSSVTTLEAAKPAQPMMYFPPPPKKAAGKGKVSYA